MYSILYYYRVQDNFKKSSAICIKMYILFLKYYVFTICSFVGAILDKLSQYFFKKARKVIGVRTKNYYIIVTLAICSINLDITVTYSTLSVAILNR